MSAPDVFEPESVRVTRRIRDEILDGVRLPGSKLVERDLAEELGVSRVPVREALKTLVAEGLVTPRPRTWAVVREFTPADVADLNEVRSALEVLAFRLAANRRTREGLERLRAALETELDAARAGDAARARRAAADFHETVTAIAGNDLLFEIDGLLRSRIRWLLVQHEDLDRVAAEHQALYDAIAQRDVTRVSTLILAHMGNIRYLDDPTWREDDPLLGAAPVE
ncbi:GntR family transcriptional regulator [Agromyces sp. H3Y2-19a]|uniref:GntR family transcriptional regulator n=1 Tax=Agromyces TaxID=33877 RepID=UPI001E5EB1D4|nr:MULTISPECIES: GntR family transcriptional regulator [Agromyces]MCD5345380.1 GntR family transcriptional regulator [Agromyces sp. S2-1-8]MDF0515326.1 GntR family transcriptional regulator [Agromyces chromiiresistens]